MLFLILWTEGDITSVIGVESQEPINGVITPFMGSCCAHSGAHFFLNSSNISTFSLRLKSFLFLFEIESRNPF